MPGNGNEARGEARCLNQILQRERWDLVVNKEGEQALPEREYEF